MKKYKILYEELDFNERWHQYLRESAIEPYSISQEKYEDAKRDFGDRLYDAHLKKKQLKTK